MSHIILIFFITVATLQALRWCSFPHGLEIGGIANKVLTHELPVEFRRVFSALERHMEAGVWKIPYATFYMSLFFLLLSPTEQ